MEKSHLKKIIRSTLCEIVKEESDSEKLLNMKIKNPETGDDIKLKSALAYDKSSRVYKVAKSTHDKAMQIIKKDSEKGNQDAPSSEPTKEPSSEPTKEPSSKPEKEKEKKDWEKSDEERIKDRETAKEKINQIPKEKLKKFQDADREYEKAYDKAGASTGPRHAGDIYGSMAAYNFDKVKPKLADYAPKGYEDEYDEYRDLKNKASFRSDAEKEADKEKSSQDTPSSEPDDEEARIVKSRYLAGKKIGQMPKEKRDALEKANDKYKKAMDAFDKSWDEKYKYKFKDRIDQHNAYETYKPKLGNYAPEGSDEKEFKEFRKLKKLQNQLTSTERDKMLSNNDWNDLKAASIRGMKTYDKEDYGEMFKKSHADIDNGNITKETLPKSRPTDSDLKQDSTGVTANIKKQYDIIINKAYDKNPDATKDALIKRTLDKEEEMKANVDKLNNLKNKMNKYHAGDWRTKDAKQEIEKMMGTSTSDLKFLQDKIGEKELARSIDKEKKERAYNKKSSVGKFLSKIGIGETMKKSELQAIIREEIQNFINESFSNWEVKFVRSIKNKNVGDVKKGHVETVKARGTSEAIKKACKNAGCEGAWMHVDVEVKKK